MLRYQYFGMLFREE